MACPRMQASALPHARLLNKWLSHASNRLHSPNGAHRCTPTHFAGSGSKTILRSFTGHLQAIPWVRTESVAWTYGRPLEPLDFDQMTNRWPADDPVVWPSQRSDIRIIQISTRWSGHSAIRHTPLLSKEMLATSITPTTNLWLEYKFNNECFFMSIPCKSTWSCHQPLHALIATMWVRIRFGNFRIFCKWDQYKTLLNRKVPVMIIQFNMVLSPRYQSNASFLSFILLSNHGHFWWDCIKGYIYVCHPKFLWSKDPQLETPYSLWSSCYQGVMMRVQSDTAGIHKQTNWRRSIIGPWVSFAVSYIQCLMVSVVFDVPPIMLEGLVGLGVECKQGLFISRHTAW